MSQFPPQRSYYTPPQMGVSYGICSAAQISDVSGGAVPPMTPNRVYEWHYSPFQGNGWNGFGWSYIAVYNNEDGQMNSALAPYLFPDLDIRTLVVGISGSPALLSLPSGFPADVETPSTIIEQSGSDSFAYRFGTIYFNFAELPSLPSGGPVIGQSGAVAPACLYDVTDWVTGWLSSAGITTPIYGNGLPPVKIVPAASSIIPQASAPSQADIFDQVKSVSLTCFTPTFARDLQWGYGHLLTPTRLFAEVPVGNKTIYLFSVAMAGYTPT